MDEPHSPTRRVGADGHTDRPAAGIAYNFSDESPRSALEVYEAVCLAVGVPGTLPRIEGRATDEIPAQHLRATRARQQLGWKAEVALHDGLIDTVAWYRGLFESDPRRFG